MLLYSQARSTLKGRGLYRKYKPEAGNLEVSLRILHSIVIQIYKQIKYPKPQSRGHEILLRAAIVK